MSEKDFFTLLVDETLDLQTKGQYGLSSLELKLKDYGLEFFRGEFLPQTQVLRFNTSFGVLDVPVNWSLFAGETPDGSIIDSTHDQDHFFEIIRKAWNPQFKKLLISHADGFCYMVGLKEGEETYLHDLLNPQEWLRAA